MSRQDEIKELITIHNDRLQELKKQQAFRGIYNVDPAITLEIRGIEAQIENLRTELKGIEDRGALPFSINAATSSDVQGKSQRTLSYKAPTIKSMEGVFSISQKRKYYFEHIENGQVGEGNTVVAIINHVAEINSDDPDAVLVACKKGGIWQYKHEERFRQPPLEIADPPLDMNTLEMLEWLSKSNVGEASRQFAIPLTIDDLAPVIRDTLQYLHTFKLLFFEEDDKRGQIVFSLSCPRWGYLGTLRLTKRTDVTYLILSDIPLPSSDEVSIAKMHGESNLFKYGKQKYRGEVMRILFDNLRQDPIWQWVNDSEPKQQVKLLIQAAELDTTLDDLNQWLDSYLFDEYQHKPLIMGLNKQDNSFRCYVRDQNLETKRIMRFYVDRIGGKKISIAVENIKNCSQDYLAKLIVEAKQDLGPIQGEATVSEIKMPLVKISQTGSITLNINNSQVSIGTIDASVNGGGDIVGGDKVLVNDKK